jgi:hypothetical protein
VPGRHTDGRQGLPWTGFREQALDEAFRPVVVAFSEVPVARESLRIDEVQRRPIRVAE